MKIDLNEFVKKLYNEVQEKSDILIPNMFSMWLNNLKYHVSLKTYEYNLSHSKYLLKYFEKNNLKYIYQLTNEELYKYIDYKKNNGCSNNYINKHILIIKEAFNYLVNADLIYKNPITIKKIKEQEKKVDIISEKTLTRIINHIENNFKIIDKIMIYLLIETGIRRYELSLIKRENINIDDNSIYLLETKNKKPGYIYFSDNTKKLLRIELENNPGLIYLFTSKDKLNPISVNTLDSIVRRLKIALNLKKLNMHMFRHTFATSILKNTNNLEFTRLLLRHNSYEVTKKYLHFIDNDLKKCSLNNNPIKKMNNF